MLDSIWQFKNRPYPKLITNWSRTKKNRLLICILPVIKQRTTKHYLHPNISEENQDKYQFYHTDPSKKVS
jgi:hypothetical protein